MLVKGRFSEQPAGSDIKEETGPGVEAKAEEDVEPKSEEQEEAEDGDIEMAEAEEDDKDQETDIVKLAVKEATNLPEGFVEWEAVSMIRMGVPYEDAEWGRSASRSLTGGLSRHSSPNPVIQTRRRSTAS